MSAQLVRHACITSRALAIRSCPVVSLRVAGARGRAMPTRSLGAARAARGLPLHRSAPARSSASRSNARGSRGVSARAARVGSRSPRGRSSRSRSRDAAARPSSSVPRRTRTCSRASSLGAPRVRRVRDRPRAFVPARRGSSRRPERRRGGRVGRSARRRRRRRRRPRSRPRGRHRGGRRRRRFLLGRFLRSLASLRPLRPLRPSRFVPGDGSGGEMSDAAVLVVAYNRADYLAETLASLADVADLDLVTVYVSQDGDDGAVARVASPRSTVARRLQPPATRGYEHWKRPRVPQRGVSPALPTPAGAMITSGRLTARSRRAAGRREARTRT